MSKSRIDLQINPDFVKYKPKQNKMYSVSAPAKIIFCGEHAVVFGSDAIASAIDLRTFATIHIAETHTITLMDLDFTSEFNPKTGVIARKTVKPAISDAILALLAIIKNVPSLEKVPPFHVKVKSDVPVGMGMGSIKINKTK